MSEDDQADDPQTETKIRKPRANVDEWRPVFLANLAQSGNVLAAAMATGISRREAYYSKNRSKKFAEDWDNVGLLVGSPDWPATRILTCLTVTPATVAEAIEQQVELIVDEKISGNWIEKARAERKPPTEIAFQFDEVSADQFRFKMIGTGCGPSDPYYLEVLARSD